jgi:hypothetical protein
MLPPILFCKRNLLKQIILTASCIGCILWKLFRDVLLNRGYTVRFSS